ncbi:antifreeze protein [Mycena vulgaris]|nr:antifreeze protein [Mycena vulgaris]
MLSTTFILSALTAIGVVAAPGPAAVNLRTTANYAILARTGVTAVAPSVITGAMAVSPIGATAMTGFSLILDPTGAIGGLILIPGLYNWTTGVSIGNDITIAGGAADRTLTIANSVKMILLGARAAYIVWLMTDAVATGTNSHLEGVFLGKTEITLQSGATADSRLLAQTLVALQRLLLLRKLCEPRGDNRDPELYKVLSLSILFI